jgi:diguanylate cyclase (GGDEF)-like protein
MEFKVMDIQELITTVEINDKILNKYQNIQLRLMKLESLTSLIDASTTQLQKEFVNYHAEITIALIDKHNQLEHLLKLEGKEEADIDELVLMKNSSDISELLLLRLQGPQNIIMEVNSSKYSFLFPNTHDQSGSVAILPLIRRGTLIGSLNLRSNDPDCYNYKKGTLFLDHLAEVLTICLDNIVLFSEITEKNNTDQLTGLKNRRFYDENAQKELDRYVGKKSFSLLMIDIDKFKTINDTYGHDVGDVVLKEVANLAKISICDDGVLCRYGGEEFVGWLPAMGKIDSLRIAEKIRLKIEDHLFIAQSTVDPIRVSVSIGVSVLTPESRGTEGGLLSEMFKKADDCLLLAKKRGRNNVQAYELTN